MKKYFDLLPDKEKEIQFIARGNEDLKRRLERIVDYLKKHDKKHKWTQNAAIITSIESFVRDMEKEMNE